MKEEWLMSGAVVPVDVETTAALVAEIHRLIDVVGGMALAQPVQEPVAWGVFEGNLHDMFFSRKEAEYMAYLKGSPAEVRPLYTTPPAAQPVQEPVAWEQFYPDMGKGPFTTPQQRPWVGLTDDELAELSASGLALWALWRAIEAKLKEKNV